MHTMLRFVVLKLAGAEKIMLPVRWARSVLGMACCSPHPTKVFFALHIKTLN